MQTPEYEEIVRLQSENEHLGAVGLLREMMSDGRVDNRLRVLLCHSLASLGDRQDLDTEIGILSAARITDEAEWNDFAGLLDRLGLRTVKVLAASKFLMTSESPAVRFELVQVLSSLKQWDAARKELSQLATAPNMPAKFLTEIALAQGRSSDVPGAIATCRRVLEAEAGDFNTRWTLAYYLIEQDDMGEAFSHLQALRALAAANAWALARVAKLAAKIPDIPFFDETSKLALQHAEATDFRSRLSVADSALLVGDFALADTILTASIAKIDPADQGGHVLIREFVERNGSYAVTDDGNALIFARDGVAHPGPPNAEGWRSMRASGRKKPQHQRSSQRRADTILRRAWCSSGPPSPLLLWAFASIVSTGVLIFPATSW